MHRHGLLRTVRFVVLPLAALLTGCALGPGAVDQPEIFVLMGQSNMSGRGLVSEAPADYRMPDPRIMLYGNDGVWKPAMEPIDFAVGQIDQVSADPMAAVGPGLAFAKSLLERQPNRRIILIPCSKGGSAIDEWAPSQARTTLYGSCLARVREAAPKGRLAGLLWYQGETDAEDTVRATAWPAKFTHVVESFRSELGAPKLRVLEVGLADVPKTDSGPTKFPGWAIVQAAQRDLRLSNYVYVSAAGLPKKSDSLHLTTASQILLGQHMAAAW